MLPRSSGGTKSIHNVQKFDFTCTNFRHSLLAPSLLGIISVVSLVRLILLLVMLLCRDKVMSHLLVAALDVAYTTNF